MRFRGIIFDMGDIFYDATPWRRELAAHLASLGIDIDYPRLVPLWEAALVPVYKGKLGYWDAFRGFLTSLDLDPKGLHEVEAAARLRAEQSEARPLFDGIAETLVRLHRDKIKLAVLSDTECSEIQIRQKLKKFQIEHLFNAVVTSCDIGYVKPQPEAFQSALQRLNLPVEAVLFVAHDIDELDGAIEFGLTTAAYNYQESARADYYLNHFQELYGLVHCD